MLRPFYPDKIVITHTHGTHIYIISLFVIIVFVKKIEQGKKKENTQKHRYTQIKPATHTNTSLEWNKI